jgi:hypothetical protein
MKDRDLMPRLTCPSDLYGSNAVREINGGADICIPHYVGSIARDGDDNQWIWKSFQARSSSVSKKMLGPGRSMNFSRADDRVAL